MSEREVESKGGRGSDSVRVAEIELNGIIMTEEKI